MLLTWPAALSGESALIVAGVRGTGTTPLETAPVHVAVDQSRRVEETTGVVVHRVCDLAAVVQPSRSLPRVRLEHSYLTRVERPHGLPTAKRQRRVKPGRAVGYRDVEYLGTATVVELDGRLGHEWQRGAPTLQRRMRRGQPSERRLTQDLGGSSAVGAEDAPTSEGDDQRRGGQAQSWPSRRSSASSMVPS